MQVLSDSGLRRLSVVVDMLRMANDIAQIPDSLDASLAKSKTTHAALVQDVFYHYFDEWCPDDAEIKAANLNGLRHLIFPDTMVRLHFSSQAPFRISVNRTDQTQVCNATDRDVQMALSGVPNPECWHHLVYTTDDMTLDIDKVAVGYYKWENPVLIREIALEDEAETALVLPLRDYGSRQPLRLKPQEQQTIIRELGNGISA